MSKDTKRTVPGSAKTHQCHFVVLLLLGATDFARSLRNVLHRMHGRDRPAHLCRKLGHANVASLQGICYAMHIDSFVNGFG
jgi:hypothetical protein